MHYTTNNFNINNNISSIFYFRILIVSIIVLFGTESRTLFSDKNNIFLFERNQRNDLTLNSQEQLIKNDITSSCNVYDNDQLHVLMDRICELCHDMFSHQLPNTRAECRSDCFRSNHFKKCLRLFKPIGDNNSRRNSDRNKRSSLKYFLVMK
uniref:Uncharacterized protein n=1 Tax=Meloidogyne enterolobii TaxID=390850 RepID=A0A6V7VQF5_MELEN|nr:unnamed protein product [Meloidogyne enterolobii]